jgi:2-methylcitrate dehydratase PrpD
LIFEVPDFGVAMELSKELAEYVSTISLNQVPQRDIDTAKLAILDQVGCAMAGVGEEPGTKVLKLIHRSSAEEASVFGSPRKTTTWLAALANGTLGHTLDFDDRSSFGHPSCILVPAMMASAESEHRSGRAMLEAFIAGYEIGEALARIVPRRSDQYHGLHSTAMFGPLTSAAVSGHLLNLSPIQLQHAWGIAASQSGGITGNFGTHTKPLHAGVASQAGVLAAELAADGFLSNPDCLEAPLGYIYSVVAAANMEGVDAGRATSELGKWHVADTWSLKKYPCGYIAQGAIDAALAYRREASITLDDIHSLEIRVPHLQPYFKVKPTGEFAGKFGYEYPVACAILDGEVKKNTFTDSLFRRPELQRHLYKFSSIEDPSSAKQGALGVLVIKAKGVTSNVPIDIPSGDKRKMIPSSDIVEKYLNNASEVIGATLARRTADMLLNIESLPSATTLLDCLSKREK